MAILKIEQGEDNPILRTVSKPVEKFDKKLAKLLDDMRETTLKVNGLGLAAPQIGINIRAAICIFNYGTEKEITIDAINPEISSLSDDMQIEEEGCLSLPGQFKKVARYQSLTFRYYDRKGRLNELRLDGLNAVVAQHEIDHLDGKLLVDRVVSEVMMEKREL